MKALLVSFFCIIWAYSLFFDKEKERDEPAVKQSEISVSDVKAVGNAYLTDTMDYYVKTYKLICVEDIF